MLELIDEIRETFPSEFSQAQQIVSERQQLMDDASAQAANMIENAHERARVIVNEKEIMKLAQLKAKKIVSDAIEISEQTRAGSENYAVEVFEHVEQSLSVLFDHTEKCKIRIAGE